MSPSFSFSYKEKNTSSLKFNYFTWGCFDSILYLQSHSLLILLMSIYHARSLPPYDSLLSVLCPSLNIFPTLSKRVVYNYFLEFTFSHSLQTNLPPLIHKYILSVFGHNILANESSIYFAVLTILDHSAALIYSLFKTLLLVFITFHSSQFPVLSVTFFCIKFYYYPRLHPLSSLFVNLNSITEQSYPLTLFQLPCIVLMINL